MMWLNRLVITSLIICSGFSLYSQNTFKITEEVISFLEKNQTTRIYNKLDPSVKGKITKRQLKTLWALNLETHGRLTDHGIISSDTSFGPNTTATELYQEKNTIILVIRATEKGKIDRFFFLPQVYVMPEAAKNIVLGKKQLNVRTDTFELNGELIFPLDQPNAPVLILVHVSGAHDLDESIGPNKVFKDLALELVLRGIATFRYNKRSFSYPGTIEVGAGLTLANECIEDASSAIKLLTSVEEIDTNRIFLLGHSLGAYAAPQIALNNPELSGIILMGSPSQPLYELIPMQLEYLFAQDDKNKLSKKLMLKRAKKEAGWLRTERYDRFKDRNYIGTYWPAVFFQNIRSYSPAQVLDTLPCRSLILQGMRDYQVPFETEFLPFQTLLENNSHVTLKAFDGLNHLFIYGEGKSLPSEYMRPGHVDIQVIETISHWMNHP